MEALLTQCTMEEFERGYRDEETRLVCVFCGFTLSTDQVYPEGKAYFTAPGSMRMHLKEHNPVHALLRLSRSITGLTEVQEALLPLLAEGRKDDEIAAALRITPSTVRNHRFRLREKKRQAEMFLKVMATMPKEDHRAPVHVGATMVDDRYTVSEEEERKILENHLTAEGAVKVFPAREKKKLVVLRHIAKVFLPGRHYSEKEVNRILGRLHEDYATLRRYLIEYGFLDRTRDGSAYFRR